MSFLSEFERTIDKRTLAVVTIGLFKTCVGTTILSMPKALANTGLVVFPLLLFGFGLVAHYSCSLVARSIDIMGGGKHIDPCKVGAYGLGDTGKWITLGLTLLDSWGSCIAFLSTLADILRPLLEEESVLGAGSVWTSQWVVVMSCTALVFPLLLHTKIAGLAWINILGIVALLAFVLGVFVEAVKNNQGLAGAPTGKLDTDCVVALTVVAFAYDGAQINVFPFYRGMPPVAKGSTRTKGYFVSLCCGMAVALSAGAYLCVAFLGFSTYRGDTKSDVLDNIDNTNLMYVCIKIFFAISLLFTVPLTLFECAEVLRQHVFGEGSCVNLFLNVGLIGSAALVASFVPRCASSFFTPFAHLTMFKKTTESIDTKIAQSICRITRKASRQNPVFTFLPQQP
ncbi:Vacuolar amino acid transporter 2 [Diplonema papillatum]|nr:Vacuolar amino acid transporter 2 [Diplonema papillatum]